MAHSVNKIEKARQRRRANFHQIIIFFHHIVRTSAIFGALICAGSGILHELCALPSGKIVTQFGARVRSTETDGPLTNCDTQKSPQQGRMRRTICKKVTSQSRDFYCSSFKIIYIPTIFLFNFAMAKAQSQVNISRLSFLAPF